MNGESYPNPCEICGATDWIDAYFGPVRDGAFGQLSRDRHRVIECGHCGIQRLEESGCKDETFYEGKRYRELLREPATTEGFWAAHDIHQLRNLQIFWPNVLRGKTVADVGCAAGSFLDHLGNLPKMRLAIEPCREYHEMLVQRGYSVYDSLKEAASSHAGTVDVAFSFSTIEHVDDPLTFLTAIRHLMAPTGLLLVSTPNRRDILMDLLGDDYRRFFYRTVHRWYFDMDALAGVVVRAGLELVTRRCLQRFGISNAIQWLRDRKPSGDRPLPHLDDPVINEFWKTYLESKGVGDYLYLLARRKE